MGNLYIHKQAYTVLICIHLNTFAHSRNEEIAAQACAQHFATVENSFKMF